MKKLPDYREKQRLLYVDKRSDRELIAYGDYYLESGRIADATDFYQKANHIPGLEKIKETAEETGDVMAFQHVLKALKVNITDDDWNRIGQRAYDLKKYTFALHAFQKGSAAAKIEQVKCMIISEDKIKTP